MSSLLTLLILSHGAYPLAYQIYEVPSQQSRFIAATTFGLLVSDDDGASWQWVCEEAIGYGQSLSPVWYVSPQGHMFGGSFRGLLTSTDHGCTWDSHPVFADLPDGGQGTGVADMHSNGSSLFAVTGKYGVVNGVYRSANGGVDWTALPGAQSNGQFFTTVRSAPSRPQRIYVGAWWFRPTPTEAIYVSDDNGETFTRTDLSNAMPMVPIGDGGMGLARGSFYVFAVDPNDPDTLWGALQQDDDPRHSFVIESGDRGQTWALRLDVSDQLNSIVVSPDGGTVWVGSSGRLYRSEGQPRTFLPLDRPTKLACAQGYGDRFYACGWNEVDGFAVGREARGTDGGFTPLLTWNRVNTVEQCPSTSKVTTVCQGLFPALVASFPVTFDPDGGGGGAGGGGGTSSTGGGSGGSGGGDMTPRACGCSAGGAEVSLTLWLVLARFAAAHALRRRRVHR